MPDDKKTELASRSNELLDAVQRLKDTEQRKRQEPISSATFHQLANEVDALCDKVFAMARDHRNVGERTPRASESIDDVAEGTDDAVERTGS